MLVVATLPLWTGCHAGQGQARAAANRPQSRPASVSNETAVNLPVNSEIRRQLLASFRIAKGDRATPPHIGGPVRGTVYYGYLPATHSYWAMAVFQLTAAATRQDQVAFQDGGGTGFFQRQRGSWKVKLGNIPQPCPFHLPVPILRVWGFDPSNPDCSGWQRTDPVQPWT